MICKMSISSKEGDVEMQWDPNKPWEVKDAENRFKELKAKGYLAFRVRRSAKDNEVMERFDPKAEKIVMSPPVVGG